MAQEFKGISLKSFPHRALTKTAEDRFWHSYSNPPPQTYAMTFTAFGCNNNIRNYYAFANGFQLKVFDPNTPNTFSSELKPIFQFEKVSSDISGLCMRRDGIMCAAGY
jgi:hypothetical protein